jgi:argininosuccinate lyase
MTLWGGRFRDSTDALMRRFNDSILFDRRLYAADIRGSVAYAGALARVGVISAMEYQQLVLGLEQVLSEFETGTFEVRAEDEDIHTAVERRLGELIGSVAGKLHTGRSRNDQVVTDMRLYLLEQIRLLGQALVRLQKEIVEKAERHIGVLMPGYTHLQQAQPLLFSHWLMSYFWKLQRDRQRLADVAARTSVLPLGAGALAGNPLAIDRQALATDLGFASVTQNSVDAVGDRDFLVEFLAWAALLQVHLSGLAEDLIIWSSPEYGFVELNDAYTTGSSLMPQKKNPDSLELLRGKSGRVIGHLVGLLVALKGMPSAYHKDLQEDKEGVFDAIDTLSLELPVVGGVIRTLSLFEGRMAAALDDSILATDLADYLVQKGVPFRQSHHLVGRAVRRAEALGVSLAKLELSQYQAISPAFAQDLYAVFDFQQSVAARKVEGGTAPDAVQAQVARARELLAQDSDAD